MGRAARVFVALALLAGGVVLVPAPSAQAAKPPVLPGLPAVDPASPSLSPDGRALLERASLEGAPRYALSVTVDPDTGDVDGRMRARVARPDDGSSEFRMLAGLPALEAGLRVSEVTVNGKEARPEIDRTLLRVPVKRGAAGTVDVRLHFSYRVPRAGSTRGRPLSQETIGVLTRTRSITQLGHWFPLWLPPGAAEDPGLAGYGDIGNFAAGAITARVQVPTGYDVVSGGVTSDTNNKDGRTTQTESGVGLRDLALAVGRDLRTASTSVGGVSARVSGEAGLDVEGAAAEAAADLQALGQLYVPYPWAEVDVVVGPLGAGVGGMEWPGMVWVAGVGQDILGQSSMALAHELAHEWWHALVGNDSIAAPVVDEPLAQYSMCLVVAQSFQGGGGDCIGIGAPRSRGRLDTCADRPTPDFRSADEYGALIYEQAAGFYFALSDTVGRDATVATLRGVVQRHAFGSITSAQLHDELVAAFPDRADEVRALWDRYIGPPGCAGQ
jgi:Peptidase family M1 domain